MFVKKVNLIWCLLILTWTFFSCSSAPEQQLESKNGFAVLPVPQKNEKVADFAGGCFWAMQECMIELKGVHKVVSGYAGGETENPSYGSVLKKNTGHAEAVQVYYDPKVITFEQLVEAFFHAHDPTQIDGQGPDLGSDYRSIAFYRNMEEYKTIRKVSDRIDSTHYYTDPIMTEMIPFKVFYPAETEHQNYYPQHLWDPYIRKVSKPKVLKLRHEMKALIKVRYME